MPVRRSIPPAAPRAARRDPAPDSDSTSQTASQPESSAQHAARVQARTAELLCILHRGEAPEEIILKGQSLVELKQLAPWALDGTRTFRRWARAHLPFSDTRANQYIRIHTAIDVELVRGRPLCTEQLLVLTEASPDQHQELIAAAVAGASARELRLLAQGNQAQCEPEPEEQARRVLGHQRLASQKLRLLLSRPAEQVKLTPLLLRQLAQGDHRTARPGPQALRRRYRRGGRYGAQRRDERGGENRSNGRHEKSATTNVVTTAEQSKTAEPAPEAPAQRDLRLCAPYEPVPYVDPGFELEVRPEWPEDWYESWIQTPVGPDPILLCAEGPSPQRGTLGHSIQGGHRVSLNLNGCFGGLVVSNPGGGKTYACNVVTHMSLARLRNANELPSPMGGVMSHYHEDDDHEPEALSMRYPNHSQREVSYLVDETHSLPVGLEDIVLLCFPDRVERMRQRHPHVQVYPLLLASRELTTAEIESILGLDDINDDRLYVRQLRQALRGAAPETLVEVERRLLAIKDLQTDGRRLVEARFALLRPHICDEHPLGRLRKAGRLVIVDGRDPTRSREDALTLMNVAVSVLLRREEGQGFNMLWRIDELHEFLKHKPSVSSLLMRSRKRRHLGVSILCATQYPRLVPQELLANMDLILLGRTQDEEAVRFLGKIKSAFDRLKAGQAAVLKDGEMFVWSEKVYVDPAAGVETLEAVFEMQVRSQNAQHGGQTRAAVPVEEDEGEEQ